MKLPNCPGHVIICILFVGNNFIWKTIGLQYLKSMKYRSILIFKFLSSDYEGAVSIGQKVSNTKMTHKHCDCRHSNRLKQPQNTGFFSSLQPNFDTSWKVAWVLYSERYVRVVVTEKFWKNLKLSKYFNKSAPCHTSLPDQLNLDRHSLRPVSKSLENALSSLGFTRTKDNFRNSDSLLNYYHIVFFGTMNKRNKEKNAHWSNLQKIQPNKISTCWREGQQHFQWKSFNRILNLNNQVWRVEQLHSKSQHGYAQYAHSWYLSRPSVTTVGGLLFSSRYIFWQNERKFLAWFG